MICATELHPSCELFQKRGALRRPKLGPEMELVSSFFESGGLPSPQNEEQLIVFMEPKVENAFPDLVAVYWKQDVVQKWSAERAIVQHNDLRLIQYLHVRGETPVAQLIDQFGRQAKSAIDRLNTGGLLIHKNDSLQLRSSEQIFAITRLIAVEAKMSDWNEGLSQALQNTWFASESYLLLPSLERKQHVRKRAESLGVGLVSLDVPIDYSETMSRHEMLPQSHGCWIFNEWLFYLRA